MRAFEEDLSDYAIYRRALALGSASSHLEQQIAPRGYRMLQRLPFIPGSIIANLVERFGLLSNILQGPALLNWMMLKASAEVRARYY